MPVSTKILLTIVLVGLTVCVTVLMTQQPTRASAPTIIPDAQIVADPPPPTPSYPVVCNKTDLCASNATCLMLNESSFNCTCDRYHFGPTCNETCPGLCSGVGDCISQSSDGTFVSRDTGGAVTCNCPRGYAGSSCQIHCPNGCSNHGNCSTSGTCACEAGYGEADCSVLCPNRCSQHGYCGGASGCVCDQGYWGSNCSTPQVNCTPEMEHQEAMCEGTGGTFSGTFPLDACRTGDRVLLHFQAHGNCAASVLTWGTNVRGVTIWDSQSDPSSPPPNITAFAADFTDFADGYMEFELLPSLPRTLFWNMSCETSNYCARRRRLLLDGCNVGPPGSGPTVYSALVAPGGGPPPPWLSPLGSLQLSWEPHFPQPNTLAAALTRPPGTILTQPNPLSQGLGWASLAIVVLSLIVFVTLFARHTNAAKSKSSPSYAGRSFCSEYRYQLKVRHGIVGLCYLPSDSLWSLPANFLLLFLNTFLNLAVTALWLGTRSTVGEFIASVGVTTLSVAVVTILSKLSLKDAHAENVPHRHWHLFFSYAGPMILTIWAACMTVLLLLLMTDEEAEWFMLRAAVAFGLQYTVAHLLVTLLVLIFTRQARGFRENAVATSSNDSSFHATEPSPLPPC